MDMISAREHERPTRLTCDRRRDILVIMNQGLQEVGVVIFMIP